MYGSISDKIEQECLLKVSPATPVYCINKTDRHDTTEIFLKVTLNTINLNQPSIVYKIFNIGKGPGGSMS
jgi:hypothetical protein